METTKYLLTVKECCALTGIGENRFYELIRHKLITPLKLNKKGLKIRPAELERFLKDCEGKDLSDLNNIKKIDDFSDLENER